MAINDPVRDGRFWLWPDGTRLPVVSGGADDDPPETDDDPDPEEDHDDDPPEPGDDRSRQALRRANREAASWRKKFRGLEQRLKEAETADQSKLDKLTQMMEAAEKRASEAERKALVAEIAQSKGLSASQAKRLQGATREELEDDADELLEAFGPKPKPNDDPNPDKPAAGDGDGGKPESKKDDAGAKPSPSTGKPKEKLQGGATPSDAETPVDSSKLAESILKQSTFI